MSIGNLTEFSSQQILVGKILEGRLGAATLYTGILRTEAPESELSEGGGVKSSLVLLGRTAALSEVEREIHSRSSCFQPAACMTGSDQDLEEAH